MEQHVVHQLRGSHFYIKRSDIKDVRLNTKIHAPGHVNGAQLLGSQYVSSAFDRAATIQTCSDVKASLPSWQGAFGNLLPDAESQCQFG